MEEAWLTERLQVASALARPLSRPSGLPTASKPPRTTRWVCRWTRWSRGLPEETPSVATEYESAKSLEVKASRLWATHGVSPT